ncbi:MAG: iron-containing alcohol dehydrogenase [Oscillospiraceae bacterium]|jgi:alcohol dehydrogenase|nr:iron-containing alcohol dehydrogenase [Oscillospiraceae bacterium]
MANTFTFTAKPPILFGSGAVSLTGSKAAEFGWSKVILISDKGIAKAGLTAKVAESLAEAKIDVVVFDDVLPDPTDLIVEAAAEIARSEKVSGIVAIGGGSVLDTGKAVNVLLANPSPISQYLGFVPGVKLGPGAILIPTTAGTGSEVSDTAIITDTSRGIKVGVGGECSKAKLAIIDPELTYKLPAKLTAETALDAFAHGFEAFTGTAHNPLSDIFCKETMRLVAENLLVVLDQPDNVSARSNLALAATLGGIAFGDSLTHLGHNIGQNIATLTHMPHGLSCTLGLLAIIEFLADAVPARLRWVGGLFGLNVNEELTDAELGHEVSERFKAFAAHAGIPTTLKAAGIPHEVLAKAAPLIENDPVLQITAPKKLNAAAALELMEKIYE